MATNNNDFIFFSGSIQTLSVLLENPYSETQITIDGDYHISNDEYDGLGGVDRLYMSQNDDFISLISLTDNNTGMQLIKNIEAFYAQSGGDIINLAHETIEYGDVSLFGGNGDDILWSNIGNDTIIGLGGDDLIDGGPGDDHLSGYNDNDQIYGGKGNDFIDGGASDDILYGGTSLGLWQYDKSFIDSISFPELKSSVNIENLMPPGTDSLGINADNLTLATDATATLTFVEGYAGYNNSLGLYSIAEDGTIQMGQMLWANVKTAGYGVSHEIDLPLGADGGQFGFFIIADGDRKNSGYNDLDITEEGNIKFVYDFGGANERAATIHDDGTLVSVVYDDGSTISKLSGHHYHTTARGDSADINSDNLNHAVSGLADSSNPEILRIGFEDLFNWGDADFEDVLFDLDINRIHVDSTETGADTLIAGQGNDYLYGEGGDDILAFGMGLDHAYGGSGSDMFYLDYTFLHDGLNLKMFDTLVDQIYDFDAGEGDTINIHDLLQQYDPLADAIDDFVRLVDNGGNTEIQADIDGGGDNFVTYALIVGGTGGADLADLITSGNVINQEMTI
ncbi:MAG: type I secretion C-terminal target domain-containing protein [Micavibrio sp.]|nr:type I secretion C-terminal target domain-containing protein [Micavibrio sp.]